MSQWGRFSLTHFPVIILAFCYDLWKMSQGETSPLTH